MKAQKRKKNIPGAAAVAVSTRRGGLGLGIG